jgi:serine/threonine-protein kinase
MALIAGSRLGPYEIQSIIGAGGMGEVYEALDPRLDRIVAIKVLPREVSADPERRARFAREAKTVAALNHPHICTLHDVGEHEEQMFLVMELLSGEPLAERLRKGALPLDQTLAIATDIADALSVAHRHGVIHRDLKPANVMLTATGPKLLDFGLAKPGGPHSADTGPTRTSRTTVLEPITARGIILGTMPYMSPEQLEGRDVDHRSDIWALGAMLFEMMTGRPAFAGESSASLVGQIMNTDPPALETLLPFTPPLLDRLVRQCLAKDPNQRPDTAHDVAQALRWVRETAGTATTAAASSTPWRRTAALAAVGILAGAVLGAFVVRRSLGPVDDPVVRSALSVTPADALNSWSLDPRGPRTPGGSRTAIAWTSDGRSLVYVGRQNDIGQIYVRPLEANEAHPLAGTVDARAFAISEDGRSVAFWAQRTLKRVALAGGPTDTLAGAVDLCPSGLALDGSGGRLWYGHAEGPIWTVAPGESPRRVTTLEAGEFGHIPSAVLPGDRHLLFTVKRRVWTWGGEVVVALDLRTGARTTLVHDGADARYSRSGHLVFLREGTLYATRFDPDRLQSTGPSTPLVQGVAQSLFALETRDATRAGQFAVSTAGALAWVPGALTGIDQRALVAVDRAGKVTTLSRQVGPFGAGTRVSPDGRRLALFMFKPEEVGLWLYDLERGSLMPLHRAGEAMWPLWSRDGKRVVFNLLTGGEYSLQSIPADGSAPPDTLASGNLQASSWTPDGRLAAARDERDVVVVGPGMTPARLDLEPHGLTYWTEVSPDGQWVSYGSNTSGRFEVYVRPFPGLGGRVAVSTDGGSSPAWNPNGRELFFLSAADRAGRRRMMAVTFMPGTPPRIGQPRPLFEYNQSDLVFGCSPTRCYDISPDGQRFYTVQVRVPLQQPTVTHVNLVMNWFRELSAKVPVNR